MAGKITGLVALSLLSSALAAQPTSLGCYKNGGELSSLGDGIYQTTRDCWKACSDQGYPVFALFNGGECFCGNKVPPANSLVETSLCDVPCAGSAKQNCGGRGTWTVLLDPSADLNELSNPIATDIITASDSETDPPASFSVNPTIVETGIQIATQDPEAASTTIPSSILTAPSSGPGSDQQFPEIDSIATTTLAGVSRPTASSASANPAASTPPTDAATLSRPLGTESVLGAVLVSLFVPLLY